MEGRRKWSGADLGLAQWLARQTIGDTVVAGKTVLFSEPFLGEFGSLLLDFGIEKLEQFRLGVR